MAEATSTALPVLSYRKKILRAIHSNDVTIVTAETGSGKTTQIPQFLLDANPSAKIAVTQPRRVACSSVARRVAEERGVVLGQEVGYSVRFDDKTTNTTRIAYVRLQCCSLLKKRSRAYSFTCFSSRTACCCDRACRIRR